MAGIEEVLDRLDRDPTFRRRLLRDPVTALSGYVLYDEDLAVLADRLREGAGTSDGDATSATVDWLTVALTEAGDAGFRPPPDPA